MNMNVLYDHTIGRSAAILAIVAVLILGCSTQTESDMPESIRDVALETPIALADVKLLDDQQQPVTLENFTGHWTLVTFGYTHCPDICPATLSQIGMLYKLVQQDGVKDLPRVYFVSVDPQRDALEYLGEYTRYFNTAFIGISGDQQALKNFEDQFGVFHRYEKQSGSENYLVDHSADIFLVDPQARIVASFQPPMNLRQVADLYAGFVDYYAGKQS